MTVDSLTVASLGLAGDVRHEQIALFGLLSFDAIPVDVGNPALATLYAEPYWLMLRSETQLAAAFAEADTLALTSAQNTARSLASALSAQHSTLAVAMLASATCDIASVQLANPERSSSMITAMAMATASFAEADAVVAASDAELVNDLTTTTEETTVH